MDYLLQLVDQFGYVAMFLFSWIVFIGLPIPNEMAAAFAGYLSEWRNFDPTTSFLFMYSGLISYGAFGFLLGKRFGTRLLQRLFKGRRKEGLIKKSREWMERYGLFAISISYFIPGVRLVMPYIAGTGKDITFVRFIIYATPSAGVWALVYFQIGRYFPKSFQSIVYEISSKAGLFAIFIFSCSLVYYVIFIVKKKAPIMKRKKLRYRK
ncbi:DedA family protein [Rossellomorea aquimaris]|uniref:DedA family protein n=1 Tax=Rossellomorea aquimaris TaxID=189382 RepID=UPI001CD1CAB4|nr:DedA family protein [Rossellomorea aquimaris]MCA1053958.1 DedA family protein [Rossellomorea aquimaris]